MVLTFEVNGAGDRRENAINKDQTVRTNGMAYLKYYIDIEIVYQMNRNYDNDRQSIKVFILLWLSGDP